jgi:hypothetical protein
LPVSRDHVVVEHAGGAHDLVLIALGHLRRRADARRRGEVVRQFVGCEDAFDRATNRGTFSAQSALESAALR